jgi:hypothetical protein
MYVKTAEGFINPEALLTNFGLEIRPQVILSIARFEFDNQIHALEEVINRPREGDLIYFPLNKRSFQINFVNDKPFFYQHGKLQMYDCTCELYEYSNERFETGIEEIDEMYFNFSFNAFDHALLDHNGLALTDETGNILVRETLQDKEDEFDPLVDNTEIEEESDREGSNTLIDWSENNPFSEGRY